MKRSLILSSRYAVWLIVLCYLCVFLFVQPFAFNFEIEANAGYPIYLSGVALLLLTGVMLMIKWRSATANSISLYFLTALLVFFQTVSFEKYGPSNEFLTSIDVLLAIYVALTMLKAGTHFAGVLHLLLIFWVIEVGIAVRQFSEATPSEWSTAISGTLGNSGIFTCYIVIHIPLGLYWLKRRHFSRPVKGSIAAAFFLILAMVIYCTRSRTAIISSVVSLSAITALEYREAIKNMIARKKWIVAGGVLLAGMAAYYGMHYLLQVKKLSVSGRALMLKVAEQHVFDHFWLGTGIGRFTWYYPQWQADYFRMHPDPPLDLYLSAGKAYVIFNEYLQLLEEGGIFIFLLFLFLLYDFFRSRSTAHKELLNYLKITVLAILACGFTSYPFHINVLLLILVICLITGYAIREKRNVLKAPAVNPFLVRGVLYGSCLLLLYAGWQAVHQNMYVWQWRELRSNDTIGRVNKRRQYESLYEGMRYDGKFLLDYGEFLSRNTNDCDKAVHVLEECKTYFISYQVYNSAAAAYKCAGKYDSAIANYQFLSWYVPNRFRPKYEMSKVYLKTGDIPSARSVAATILSMPVKVPSAEEVKIKAEMQQLLDTN